MHAACLTGELALDDLELLERIAPELKVVKVLDRDLQTGFKFVEKQRGITLRMLLTHTGKKNPVK